MREAMSRILVTSRPGFFKRLANLRPPAAAREVRGMEESPTRGASIIAADLDHHAAESLDAVAGSEFVDDRIRLRE